MWHIFKPSTSLLAAFKKQQESLQPTYDLQGSTRNWLVTERPQNVPIGYVCDQNSVILGYGEAAYRAAVEGLLHWKMFPAWATVSCDAGPPVGATLTLLFRLASIYWRSAGSIVYTVDEVDVAGARQRVGFAYGTLPGHVESGEERFTIAWRNDDAVVYELQAFSKPNYWLAILMKPLARRWQRKFVKDSQAALQNQVQQILGNPGLNPQTIES